MRCIFLLLGVAVLSGCAIDPTSTSQLVTGGSAKINALSSINKQLGSNSSATAGEYTSFAGCISSQQNSGAQTLAHYLTTGLENKKDQHPITISSDNLSTYSTALWTYSKQNKKVMLRLLALHRAHDKTCFEREIVSQKSDISKGNASARQHLSDYEQSHKILGNIYDYLHSTLSATDFSELDEQFARDHIPVKVLLPVT